VSPKVSPTADQRRAPAAGRTAILKYLRIAVGALCLIACVLVMALWVRSYWKHDVMFLDHSNRDTRLGSQYGTVYLYSHPPLVPKTGWRVAFGTLPSPTRKPTFMFECQLRAKDTRFRLPHWYIAPLFAAAAFAPRFHWSRRFSLRTLLIATALVALAMGSIIAIT
jgi:hypothetical protein